EQARQNGRGKTRTFGASDKRIDRRYNPEGTAEGAEMVQAFEDVIAQLDPALIQEYGKPFAEMHEAQQNGIMMEFDTALEGDMDRSNAAAKRQDLSVSNKPRTGARGLRVMNDSDINFRNVWDGEATPGDWWAGAFDTDPYNDRMVIDPETRAKMSLRAAARAEGGGRSLQAQQRFGYLKER
ncbi:MAG: hypothetical protein DRR06_20350, partial [Gammaproteobacteria bacterium]